MLRRCGVEAKQTLHSGLSSGTFAKRRSVRTTTQSFARPALWMPRLSEACSWN